MPVWLKTIIGVVIVAVLGVLALFLYQMHESCSNDYDTIAQHWTRGGKFIDYAQDLGVTSVDDMHYFVNKDNETVEISYGYVQLVYTWKELKNDDELYDKLRYIGLTYKVNKEGNDFKFYWQGAEMEPWYRSIIVK